MRRHAARRNEEPLARELMSTDVITVNLGCSLQGLASLLHTNSITGVPVVDDDDKLVGVVSASDLVRHQSEEGVTRTSRRAVSAVDEVETVDPDSFAGTPPYFKHAGATEAEVLRRGFHEEDYGAALVCDVYTPYVVTAPPNATRSELSKVMVRRGVHRVLVVEHGTLKGIVTSMDVLRSLAKVGEVARTAIRRAKAA